MKNITFNSVFGVLLILILTAINISSCFENKPAPNHLIHSNKTDYIYNRHLTYVKDIRTDMCFVSGLDYSWTYIPCTPKVEELINQTNGVNKWE